MDLPKRIELIEVCPRDGFQNVHDIIPFEGKVAIIKKLAEAGFKRLEVVSFVSPKAIPQMADAKEVVAAVRDTLKAHGVRTVALVPNAWGVETAVECGINELTYVISVSRSHNIANVRRTPEESMEQFKTLIQEYGHKIDFRLALATALGCPFGEEIRTERVAEMVQFGLDRGWYEDGTLQMDGCVNLMKGAIYAADYVTTVSPTYAKELQYAFYAHGLEGVIADNYHKFTGILNGIDMEHNNPATDPFLPAPYSAADPSGKAACKAALQEKLGLNVDPDVPIIACISRLVAHKGYELVTAAFPKILEHYVQFVVLGTGDWGIESFFRMAAQEYPGRVSANLMYSAELASQLYAGADLLLMPSISEPCGLSQMIAMRYGTVPIVRLTGGLKDSVPSYNPTTGTGLGFTFGSITPGDLLGAIDRGLEAYETDRPNWTALMKRGMTTDFSWDQSAAAYEKVYQKVMR